MLLILPLMLLMLLLMLELHTNDTASHNAFFQVVENLCKVY